MKKKENSKKNEYYDILLTDIQFHIQQPVNPNSAFRQVLKSIKNKKPGRFFEKIDSSLSNEEFTMSCDLSPQTIKEMQDAEKLGKKIRFIMPEGGIPIYAGKDLIQKIEADKKKKWLRA